MVSNSRPFFFRLLCLFLACLILANALIIPVRASAVEFLGFTIRSLLASLIRGCGVYVADGIQDSLSDGLSVWESLVDYVGICLSQGLLWCFPTLRFKALSLIFLLFLILAILTGLYLWVRSSILLLLGRLLLDCIIFILSLCVG